MNSESAEASVLVSDLSRRRFVVGGASAASVGLTVALLPSAVAAASGPGGDGLGGGPSTADFLVRVTEDGFVEILWLRGTSGSFNYNFSYSVSGGTFTPVAGVGPSGNSSDLSGTTDSSGYFRIGQLSGGASIVITATTTSGASVTATASDTSGPLASGSDLAVNTAGALRILWDDEVSWTGPFEYDFTYVVTGGTISVAAGVTSTSGASTSSAAGGGRFQSKASFTAVGTLTVGATCTVTFVSRTTPSVTLTLAGTRSA